MPIAAGLGFLTHKSPQSSWVRPMPTPAPTYGVTRLRPGKSTYALAKTFCDERLPIRSSARWISPSSFAKVSPVALVSFREFHRSFPIDPDVAPWSDLTDWHDTSAWLANHRSYELVSGAAADLTLLPYGKERLLVLAGQRPLTSWVPFTTYVDGHFGTQNSERFVDHNIWGFRLSRRRSRGRV